MTVTKLAKLLAVLEAAGHGGSDVCAEHDIIYLCSTDAAPEDSDLGRELASLGAHASDADSWAVFT